MRKLVKSVLLAFVSLMVMQVSAVASTVASDQLFAEKLERLEACDHASEIVFNTTQVYQSRQGKSGTQVDKAKVIDDVTTSRLNHKVKNIKSKEEYDIIRDTNAKLMGLAVSWLNSDFRNWFRSPQEVSDEFRSFCYKIARGQQ